MVSSVPDDNFQMDFGAKQCFFFGKKHIYWYVFFRPKGDENFEVFVCVKGSEGLEVFYWKIVS